MLCKLSFPCFHEMGRTFLGLRPLPAILFHLILHYLVLYLYKWKFDFILQENSISYIRELKMMAWNPQLVIFISLDFK